MRAQPRTKEEVTRDLREAVRKYKGNFAASDLFDATDTAVPANDADLKAWAQAGWTAAMNLNRTIELKSTKELLTAVEQQYRAAYNKAGRGQQPAEILAAFDEWKVYPGEEAWDFFQKQQSGVSEQATAARDAKVRLKAIADNGHAASGKALEMRNRFPQGPSGAVGTVCAGLADSAGGAWGGSSGHGNSPHAVMAVLLSSVNQVEDWETHVCGEVDAMNQYLTARGITNVNQIPKGELFSHAETWQWEGRKWIARGPCKNCKQWLEAIEANLV